MQITVHVASLHTDFQEDLIFFTTFGLSILNLILTLSLVQRAIVYGTTLKSLHAPMALLLICKYYFYTQPVALLTPQPTKLNY